MIPQLDGTDMMMKMQGQMLIGTHSHRLYKAQYKSQNTKTKGTR